MSRETRAAARSPNEKRFVYLLNLGIKAPDRAHLVGVAPNDLPEYIQAMVNDGLLDFGERITQAGSGFVAIAKTGEKGLNKRGVWRVLGDTEDKVDEALDTLRKLGLVERTEAGMYVALI